MPPSPSPEPLLSRGVSRQLCPSTRSNMSSDRQPGSHCRSCTGGLPAPASAWVLVSKLKLSRGLYGLGKGDGNREQGCRVGSPVSAHGRGGTHKTKKPGPWPGHVAQQEGQSVPGVSGATRTHGELGCTNGARRQGPQVRAAAWSLATGLTSGSGEWAHKPPPR